MTAIVAVLGDQLSVGLASLRAVARDEAVVLMAEVAEEASYVRHHKQKLVLVFSAMRHFAAGLEAEGWRVDYRRLDGADTGASLTEEVAAAVVRHGATGVVSVLAGEHRVRQAQQGWAAAAGVPVELLEDDRFLVRETDFARWAEGRKSLRMEDFYRWQRHETGLLMAGRVPVGGQWNFDKENRKRLPKGVKVPEAPHFAPDAVTREVMALVEARFGDNFGTLEGFGWPVTRGQALEALRRFVDQRLAGYGDFQDAMAEGHATLFHALISTAMNLGLLGARECIDAAVAALELGAPLNAVEGFVRQILGWREFVRAVYFREGPDYVGRNALGATRPLPSFYWTGGSGMRCFDAAFGQTRDLAYAHHIQRLMVLGNFALLAGVDPAEVQEWFLVVYADAYEWVEAPNVAGMSQYADGGVIASKPYAAGGAYIDRMSDHCGRCRYSPKVKSGPGACPFSLLYWDFVARHEERFARNPRMWPVVQGWRRMGQARQAELRRDAAVVLARL
jgi:deoxyribodipyrimidine photolyase-related protein